ncbi:putative S-layer protein [Hyella patelloides LEGE 07179]|uniref:Putative S-layer protein n=1 Tax=Hyella patelloides LEGE 07179 TaxID=945734 RepID=A0A563W577_9CYAN|nr:S-layer homology domain-containing protein [Hyella patelloides]VEP18828.1 putative S-layer protein [Hyella patelloides LEGE 07179]
MLFKQTQFKVILYSTLLGLSALLNACGNSQQLEQALSADPDLQSTTEETATDETTATQDRNSQPTDEKQQDIQLTKLPKGESATSGESLTKETEQAVANLPENLPFYPQATLEVIAPQSTKEKGVSEWRSRDRINTIVDYYQEKWQGSDWQVIQPFKPDSENNPTAIVSRDDLDFTILLAPPTQTEENSQEETQLTIIYQAAEPQTAATAETSEEKLAFNNDNLEESNSNTEINNSPEDTEEPNIVASEETNAQASNQSNSFADIAETPEQLRQYVQDLAALGVVSPKVKDTATNSRQFQPNETITRREYAKWLVRTNNKYYADSPGNKILLANKSTNAAFKDIGVNDPDFAEIQGLAEAGLIPSPLTSDSSSLLFQPDAPLTREDLITWKVPLDVRGALPNATVTAIQEAWGFQDASKIDPLAISALFADYQNSDRSNVKRIFGYTTLFQPKKAVTRAEAATSLWYFGYQGEGITAKEALTLAE